MECNEESCDGTWNGGCDYLIWTGFCPKLAKNRQGDR